ncbi:enteropeptidase [Electrophorus electricus]|uniref:enteropeptidase n=1 Tax=Electrophorus electricus TaxID=8005 RepID=UPI0015D0BEB8|nr:enteropeptidase [Electrophorus electricus]
MGLKWKWSSFEVLLTTTVLLLSVVCVGLVAVSWLAFQPAQGGSNDVEFHGRLVITEGATFTEELRNKSSLGFKALAFDMQLLVTEAYERSALREQFRMCMVTEFSRGSVVVHFHLVFRDAVKAAIAQEQLVSSIQTGDAAGLSIDSSSIQVTVGCPEGKKACSDGTTCVPVTHFCDGIPNCPDGLDESERHCATVCDGQFLLLGPSGYFHSKNFPLDYDNNTACRWIIRANDGLAIKIIFEVFQTQKDVDILVLYEGIGPGKKREYLLSGSSPGTIWLLSSEVTVEFSSNLIINEQGFSATYWAEDITHLSNEEKINCTFEEGFCFWRQDHEDDDDWIRAKGFTFPALTGPLYDHTLGNESGYYIITQSSQGYWRKAYRIQSLPLASENGSVCLRFWYHMYGMDVWRLIIMTKHESAISTLFLKEGNYGDNWNYGQITINHTADHMVVFEAQKNGGLRNNIALDDISMTSGPCGEGVPGPTTDPHITIPPPTPSDCGGPFDLYLSNSTFSSPNYPNNYGNQYSCLWILHAEDGQNIQLHFQDFGTETSYDVVEVRDGEEPHSRLLAVLTGNRVFPDLFSTTSRLTVRFTTDLTGKDRGFLANFSTGIHLGQPEACETGQYQCRSGECVPSSSVCDGTVSCPDGSDESYCVHLMSVNATGAQRLRIQVEKILYTVCAEVWSHQLPNFFCRYLGFRSGNISFVPLSEEDSPFATVTLTTEGTLELKPSEKCPGEKVISLYCSDHPCGTRKIAVGTSSRSSTLKEASSEKQETSYYGMGRVVGGEDAQKGAWPWMVSLKWQGRHVCGAALIDREWLVTAAHCVYGKNIHLSYWEAVLGVHTQNNDETSERQTHLVDQVIMNQLYNRETKDADIALMHLKTQVNFTDYIQPICLPVPKQQFEPGRKCVIAGWGYLTEGGSVANILQQAVLPILSRAQCQEWLPEYDITERMVCAGYAEGGIDSCKGDSGGPLMCEEDNHWVLVGVTAFGKGCGQPQRPGAYARVSQFTDWVLETRRLSSVWHGDG